MGSVFNGLLEPLGSVFLPIALLSIAVSFFALQAKRCHDIGWSGVWSLLSFVPYVQFAWWLLLGTITKEFLQQQKERETAAKEEQQRHLAEEAEANKRKQEAQERIKRAEDFILSSGDPKAISLLLLARKIPANYTQILVGGMNKGSSTLKNALGLMAGFAVGSLATTASFAAIQNALEDMQPDIASMDFEPYDGIETVGVAGSAEDGSELDLDSCSGLNLGDLLD